MTNAPDPLVRLDARVPSSLHDRAARTAAARGQSLDAWLADVLQLLTPPVDPPGDRPAAAGVPRPVPPVDLQDLLTAHHVAALLRLDPHTVRRYAATGQLPGSLRIGRSWRIPRAALDHWLQPT